MLKLPINQIDQLPKNELLFIFNKILDNNYTVRLIGGCVRDLLLDRPVTDFDIATSMLPQKIVEVFTECSVDLNVKCISTALKYGTIILIVNNKKFEVTTLRKDTECLGRAANVEFIDDWKEDATDPQSEAPSLPTLIGTDSPIASGCSVFSASKVAALSV